MVAARKRHSGDVLMSPLISWSFNKKNKNANRN
jgi:hypothetical protein